MNSKSFKLYVRSSKLFSLVISGFSTANTLIFNNRFKLKFTFAMTLLSKLNPTIRIKSPKINVSKFALKTKFTSTINVKTIKLIVATKATVKTTATIVMYIPITVITKARMKLGSVTIKGGITRLTFSPILAKLLVLRDHDTSTLGTLDVKTLGELDFQNL